MERNRIPRQTGETSPGEIIALLHVMAGFQGQEFEEAECEQLLSGSPCSSALAADVALQSPARLATAEQVFALSVEAMNAPLAAYHPALKELWGDPYAAAALDNLNRDEYLDTSGRSETEGEVHGSVQLE